MGKSSEVEVFDVGFDELPMVDDYQDIDIEEEILKMEDVQEEVEVEKPPVKEEKKVETPKVERKVDIQKEAERIEKARSERQEVKTKGKETAMVYKYLITNKADFSAVDAAEEEMATIPGVRVTSTGTLVSKAPFEKFTIRKDMKARIGLITDRVVIADYHYIENVGSIFCLSTEEKKAACCKYSEKGVPVTRYLYPVVVYNTDSDGKPVSKNVKVQVLVLGSQDYMKIVNRANILDDEGSDLGIADIDIQVVCTNDQYQTKEFNFYTKTALWKQNEAVRDEVMHFFNSRKTKMPLTLARPVTEDQLLEMLGKGSPTGREGEAFDTVEESFLEG